MSHDQQKNSTCKDSLATTSNFSESHKSHLLCSDRDVPVKNTHVSEKTELVEESLDQSEQKNPTWVDKRQQWMSSLFGKKVKPGRWMLTEVKNKQHLHHMKLLLDNSWELLEYKQEKLKEEERNHQEKVKCLHEMELWLRKRTESLDEREKELHEGNQRLDDRKQRQLQVEKEQEEREERLQKEFIRQQEVSLSQEANQRRLEEKEEFLMRLTQHLRECEKRKHKKGFKKGKDWMLAKLANKQSGKAKTETFVFLSEKQKKQEEEEERLQKLSKELQERGIQVQQEEQLMKENLRRMKSELEKNNLPQQKDRNQLQEVEVHPQELKPKEKEGPSGLPKMDKQNEEQNQLQEVEVHPQELNPTEKESKVPLLQEDESHQSIQLLQQEPEIEENLDDLDPEKKKNWLTKNRALSWPKLRRIRSMLVLNPKEKEYRRQQRQQMKCYVQERKKVKVLVHNIVAYDKLKDEEEHVDNVQVEQKEEEREKLSQPISHSKTKRGKWKAPFKMINI